MEFEEGSATKLAKQDVLQHGGCCYGSGRNETVVRYK